MAAEARLARAWAALAAAGEHARGRGPSLDVARALRGLSAAEPAARETVATKLLLRLLNEPWTNLFAKQLLHLDAAGIENLCALHPGLLGCPDLGQRNAVRTWKNAVTKQVYEPALVDIVEALLEARADPSGRCHFGSTTPLISCAMAGWSAVTRLLLRSAADATAADAARATALHHAAAAHELAVVQLLLVARADPAVADHAGCTAAGVATLHGLRLASGVVPPGEADPGPDPGGASSDGCAADGRAVSRKSRRTCAGGGSARAAPQQPAPAPPPRERAVPSVCWDQLAAHDLARDFVAPGRPVLVRRAAARLPGTRWTREEFVRRAGPMGVRVSAIPYGEDFGEGDTMSTTLEDFLSGVSRRPAGQASLAPYYLMFPVSGTEHPAVAALLHEGTGLPRELPPPFHGSFRAAGQAQLCVGDAGSGIPMHFHMHAINVLLTGRKHWRMVPPAESGVSLLHPADRRSEDEWDTPGSREADQEAGDVLYVPDLWSHEVLNLSDFTVGVAVLLD